MDSEILVVNADSCNIRLIAKQFFTGMRGEKECHNKMQMLDKFKSVDGDIKDSKKWDWNW